METNLKPFKHFYNSHCAFKAETENGVLNDESYIYPDVRESISEFHKNRALQVLNEEEKELFSKTILLEMKEWWGLEKEFNYSSNHFLVNSRLEFLIEQKKLLLNQLKELETIISMNTKLQKFYENEDLNSQPEEDWM
jgi:hypothetical protein